jgi:phosphoribosylformylglycinamidine (FGAM) synthase-like enzyme
LGVFNNWSNTFSISPTIASKHYLYEQYDQQVGANTIIKPGLQSSVVRVEGTNKAIHNSSNLSWLAV